MFVIEWKYEMNCGGWGRKGGNEIISNKRKIGIGGEMENGVWKNINLVLGIEGKIMWIWKVF